jgi:hypothetical protein
VGSGSFFNDLIGEKKCSFLRDASQWTQLKNLLQLSDNVNSSQDQFLSILNFTRKVLSDSFAATKNRQKVAPL